MERYAQIAYEYVPNTGIICTVTSKNCAYRDSNSDCYSRVRRSAGLSIPGRDTDCMLCGVFICALRSLYSALKSIPLHYNLIVGILFLKLYCKIRHILKHRQINSYFTKICAYNML